MEYEDLPLFAPEEETIYLLIDTINEIQITIKTIHEISFAVDI